MAPETQPVSSTRAARLRLTARSMGAVWAGSWIAGGALAAALQRAPLAGILISAFLPGLVFAAGVGLAWKWERVGGLLLVAQGLFWAVTYAFNYSGHMELLRTLFVLVTFVLPPVLAGMMFVVARLES